MGARIRKESISVSGDMMSPFCSLVQWEFELQFDIEIKNLLSTKISITEIKIENEGIKDNLLQVIKPFLNNTKEE
jgi:hypothetical protein